MFCVFFLLFVVSRVFLFLMSCLGVLFVRGMVLILNGR